MLIHIGGDIIVRSNDVIVILDVNHLVKNNSKKAEVLKNLETSKDVIKITNDEAKSLVITTDKLYYSPVSSLTLKKRSLSYT